VGAGTIMSLTHHLIISMFVSIDVNAGCQRGQAAAAEQGGNPVLPKRQHLCLCAYERRLSRVQATAAEQRGKPCFT